MHIIIMEYGERIFFLIFFFFTEMYVLWVHVFTYIYGNCIDVHYGILYILVTKNKTKKKTVVDFVALSIHRLSFYVYT